jgi:hypothetical protein
MATHCPDLVWADPLIWPTGRRGAGWQGLAPAWAAERASPLGLDTLLAGRRLRLRVLYPEGFPMVPPDLYPLDPDVPIERRTEHRWHVSGDGALCLLQAVQDWQPNATAADLVCKAAGWFIEYLLVEGGHVDAMTERGVYCSTELDARIAELFG